jgi:hypothetical protein
VVFEKSFLTSQLRVTRPYIHPAMKWFEKPPRILLGFTLLWFVVFAITFSDAGVPFPIWVFMAGLFLALICLWTIRLTVAFAKQSSERRLIRPQLHYWISIPAMLALGLLLGASPVLLSSRVYLSSDALIHNETRNGADDRWIGLFHVRESWRFDREIRFITNECGLVDTCGLIYSPDGQPQRHGEDSFDHLYGPWWHWYQSW